MHCSPSANNSALEKFDDHLRLTVTSITNLHSLTLSGCRPLANQTWWPGDTTGHLTRSSCLFGLGGETGTNTGTISLPNRLISWLISVIYCCWESWCLQLVNFSSWVISVTSSAVSLVRSERHHSCSNVCRCRCSVSTLFYCTTLSWSTTLWTNSHSSFDSNFFAFNPWELYTKEYNYKK